jgi:hypothetical protein
MDPEEKLQNGYLNLLARLHEKSLSLRRSTNLKLHVNAGENCRNHHRHTCFMSRSTLKMELAASTSASSASSSSLSLPSFSSSESSLFGRVPGLATYTRLKVDRETGARYLHYMEVGTGKLLQFRKWELTIPLLHGSRNEG